MIHYASPTLGVPAQRITPARTALFFGCGIAIILVLYLIAHGTKPEMVAAPVAYQSYTSPDKSFVCDAPTGWEKDEAGVEGSEIGGVLFKKGAARIDLTADQSSSAMADVMNATNAQAQQAREDVQNMPGGQNVPLPPPPVPAVEQLHKMRQHSFAERYADYNELPMHAFQSQVGDARLSEWTGQGSMGIKLHGYRVTMLTTDKRIDINCRCPESNWKVLQPAFVRVIRSVTRGPG